MTPSSSSFLALLALLTTALAPAPVDADTPQRLPIEAAMQRLADTSVLQEAAISPDARWIAWTRTRAVDPATTKVVEEIYLRPATAAARAHPTPAAPPVHITAAGADTGAADEKALAFSPDSTSLAFLSDAGEPGQLQLYVMRLRDRSVRRLTYLKGFLAAPRWSPDGRTLAFLFTENAARAAGPLEAVPQETGVIGTEVLEQRIAIVDLGTGAIAQVSPADLYVYEYDWAPDGTRFAVTAAHGSGDNEWYVAQLYLIDRATGTARSVFKSSMQLAVPRFSPDGRSVAFIGGLMSDESIPNGDLYVLPVAGGEARNLTPHADGSPFWYQWLPHSRNLLTVEALDGASGIVQIDGVSGAARTLWQGPETLTAPADFAFGLALAADGRSSAVIRESFDQAPSLWAGTIGAWRALDSAQAQAQAQAHAAADAPAPAALFGAVENIHWSSDAFTVQGWLIPPAHVEPGRRYPLVVSMHGGPAWLNAPARAPQLDYAPVLATQGYYVFLPNPRGSAGFGEAFKRASIKDMGGGDLRDILAGVVRVLATHPIDPDRVGITGWSYGGFMSEWAITQTRVFRAAVAGAGCADLLSYYGENGIDEWLIPYFGASVYDDPAVYAKSSPINFIKQVRAPTLLLVGDSDVESPPAQSYEYWHALKTLGVKTELVVYPHEGHEFSDPKHVLDRMRRVVAWFDDTMPATSRTTP